MPQFDFANFMPQLAWLALFFVILYFGIVKATLPRIANLVDERESTVSGDIAAAEKAKADSDGIHTAYEAEMKAAHDAAHVTVSDAKTASIRATEAKLAEAGKALDAKASAAAADLDTARNAAVTEIERIAAEATADIVHLLSGSRPDDDTARAAVRDALAA
jgi:F-type H+-transporting ATPase subunit b